MKKGSIIYIFFTCIFLPFKSIGQEILYNNNYSVACHNCFDKKYSKNLSDALSYTSTIEIDIWDVPLLFNRSGAMKNDWYVKHTFLQKGNNNCFGGSFANCLTEIANWTAENPNHNVLTIFIDKKQGWSNKNGTRKPSDLDKLILSVFGREKIYTPSDLASKDTDVRTAVKKHNWIAENNLKGKIIFIITDATFFRPRNRILNKYLEKVNRPAVCFVAPTIKRQAEIANPKGISVKNDCNVIFYNLNFKNTALCEKISYNNYITRVFRSPETTDEINTLTRKKVNFVALFNYKLNHKSVGSNGSKGDAKSQL